jgi:RNA polymerase sigma-70 factor (ECF subfamily)
MKKLDVIGQFPGTGPDLNILLGQVAAGDRDAFTGLYDAMSGPVYGLARRVLHDAAQADEVAQEVLVEVWRTAARFQPNKGAARTWMMTLAHRRAVDRARSAQAAKDREHRSASRDQAPAFDQVSEQVETRLEHEQVRGCLRILTEAQHQAVSLAYFDGLTCRQVAAEVAAPLGAVKSRLRDALIRLRDCMN